MVAVRKTLAVLLGGTALAVGAHFILTPWYPDSWDVGMMWTVLNWFMAAGVLSAFALHCRRKRALTGRDPGAAVTREYLSANLAFYACGLLALWFFWNWFDNLNAGADGQGQINLLIWAFIDPLYVLLISKTAFRVWRGPSS